MGVKRVNLPICSGFYTSRSLPLDAQNCINWLPSLPEAQDAALNDQSLFAAQGVVEFANFNSVYPTRGSLKMSNIAYMVNGNYLFKVLPDGTTTNLGYISGDGQVSMADNGLKLVVNVTNDKAYVYDSQTNALTVITDPNFRQSNTVVFIDGYFVFTASSGDAYFISELNDPSTIDPLGFGSIAPDKILAAYVSHNELFILGEDTIQIFQNVGGSGFPFQRIPGAIIQKGLHAIFGIVYFDNTFLFIGGGHNELTAIWKVVGSSAAQKVSTDAIDYAIQKYTPEEIANTVTNSYSDNGHFCASFTIFSSQFGKPNLTFVFDATASALSGKLVWHQRQSGISANSWRVNNVVECYGRLLCGDNFDGRVGEIRPDIYTEYDEVVFRQKTSMPFSNEGKTQYFGDIELVPETGVGQSTGDYTDPQIELSYSNDGGRNFLPQTSKSLGKIGAYDYRCIWRRQGYFPRSRMMRVTCTEPVKAHVLAMQTWTDGGRQ